MPDSDSLDGFESTPGYGPDEFDRHVYARMLDPQLARVLAAPPGPAVDRYALPFPEARAQLLQERRRAQTGQPAMHAIDDERLSVHGRLVGLRWYRADPECARRPPIVYLHGGGWCVGANDTHDTLLRHLAAASGLPVCGVDYSLAPEHPFPAALEEVEAVVDTVLQRWPAALRRIVLAGDSAGANLALAEAMRRRDAGSRAADGIGAMLLFYGVFGPLRDGGSCEAYGQGGFGLTCAAQQRYLTAYLGPHTVPDARVFPLQGALGGLPPTFLLAAELDLLLDDSVRMQHAMAAAGTPSVLRVCGGMTHGFLNHANAVPAAAQALREAGSFARTVAGVGTVLATGALIGR